MQARCLTRGCWSKSWSVEMGSSECGAASLLVWVPSVGSPYRGTVPAEAKIWCFNVLHGSLHKHNQLSCVISTPLRELSLNASYNCMDDLAPIQAGRMLVQQGILVTRGALPFG